jgi:hypothetical protein
VLETSDWRGFAAYFRLEMPDWRRFSACSSATAGPSTPFAAHSCRPAAASPVGKHRQIAVDCMIKLEQPSPAS